MVLIKVKSGKEFLIALSFSILKDNIHRKGCVELGDVEHFRIPRRYVLGVKFPQEEMFNLETWDMEAIEFHIPFERIKEIKPIEI